MHFKRENNYFCTLINRGWRSWIAYGAAGAMVVEVKLSSLK